MLVAVGGILLNRRQGIAPHYTNISFREGTLLGARFSTTVKPSSSVDVGKESHRRFRLHVSEVRNRDL